MKHCNCKEAKYTGYILQRHGDITYCPYCGYPLATGYYIKVYSCTFNGEYDDDGDCRKNLYGEKVIDNTAVAFDTAKERDEYFDQHIRANLSEPVSPTYEEIDHFIVIFGTYTTTGGKAMGQGSYRKYAGQTVKEREEKEGDNE